MSFFGSPRSEFMYVDLSKNTIKLNYRGMRLSWLRVKCNLNHFSIFSECMQITLMCQLFNLPHPINAYILNLRLSPENVSTTNIYKYRPRRENENIIAIPFSVSHLTEVHFPQDFLSHSPSTSIQKKFVKLK